MAKKLNQTLLNEELKKFKLLSEYSFYTEQPKKDNDLILGSELDEADEEPVDDSNTANNDAAPNGGPNPVAPDGNQPPAGPTDLPPADEQPTDMPADAQPQGLEAAPVDDMGGIDDMSAAPEAGTDDVEVDVTQLVQGSEEAKTSAQMASKKTSELLDKFNDLEKRVASMGSIADKIETLEKEIIKRNPTPTEKLEMRSLDSFPYSVKLTDYFKEEDTYDAANTKSEEYVLTKDDVDSGFTDASIKGTFNVPEDYEEEEI